MITAVFLGLHPSGWLDKSAPVTPVFQVTRGGAEEEAGAHDWITDAERNTRRRLLLSDSESECVCVDISCVFYLHMVFLIN